MSTASSVRAPYVAPTEAQPTGPPAAVPRHSTKPADTMPAGNQPSASQQLLQQQQHQAQMQAQAASHAAAAAPVPAASQSSSRQQQQQQPAQAAAPSNSSSSSSSSSSRPALPVSSRSQYRTFILSHGVFEVESKYVMKEQIGQGAYGVVCSAFDLQKQSLMAVKKIENVFDHRSLAKRTLRELQIVRALKHENILGLERVMRPHSGAFSNVYLVSELMETDLACVIRSPQELTDEHVQFFIYQVLRGLKFIHSANVIHRDLKPRNLLVNSNCDLKICDFGLARVDDPKHRNSCTMSNYIATRWYRAPEVIFGRRSYGKAVDMWSVGCILAELIGRKPIFPGRDSFHQMTLICNVLGTPAPTELKATSQSAVQAAQDAAAKAAGLHLPPSAAPAVTDEFISALARKSKVPFRQLYPHASALACDLLDKLLIFDPDKRLTVEQALAHPYLDELHCEEDEPVCANFDYSDYYWEYLKTTKEDLRYLIHQEIVSHYPEERFDANSPAALQAAQKAGLGPKTTKEPLNSFASQMAGALPKGKKIRRKSI